MSGGITTGWVRDQLQLLDRPDHVIGVRINGEVYRATDSYFDQGDGYFVIEAEKVEVEGDEPIELADPNSRWQMYTIQGNLRMEQAFTELAARLRDGEVTWKSLEYNFNQIMNEVAKTHPECWDTEPRCEMKDQLDKVLDELGYKSLEF